LPTPSLLFQPFDHREGERKERKEKKRKKKKEKKKKKGKKREQEQNKNLQLSPKLAKRQRTHIRN
jgi:hypothetical protein